MRKQINVQVVPPFEPLLASMPSGREYHTPKQYFPPQMDQETLAHMRAPPEPRRETFTGEEDDSGDEGASKVDPVGAFPGTSRQYEATSSYY